MPKSLNINEEYETIAHFRTSFPVSPFGASTILTDYPCLGKGNKYKIFYHSNMNLHTNPYLIYSKDTDHLWKWNPAMP